MIFCKELNKSFPTRKEMFSALVDNKSIIEDKKKSVIKQTDPGLFIVKSEGEEKAEAVKLDYGDTIYPVINTTNYLDSHGDVHGKDIWNKSIQDQVNKLYYIINHDLEIGSIIALPKDVAPTLRTMKWSELGRDYKGTTTALIYEVKLTDLAPKQFMQLLQSGHPIENSVRMQYVSLAMCIDDPEYKDEYANWQQYRKEVANGQDADDLGYFWYIKEAKIIKEGSAVLFGSNDVTPILQNAKDDEPSKDTRNDNNNTKQVAKNAPKRWLNVI
jgi:hypothetical protein